MPRFRRFAADAISIGLVISLASIAAPASAQDRAGGTTPQAQPDAVVDSGEILVTARRVSESLQKVPVAVTVATGEILEDRAVVRIEDLQHIAPNLYIQRLAVSPVTVQLSMRGQKQNNVLLVVDPAVGVYIDGLYNPRSFGLGDAFVDVDRVEVVRGPQGTLYGRNTTGGAVSIFTKNPTDTLEGSVKASYGSWDARQLQGIINLPLGQDVGLRLVGQRSKRDGFGQDNAGRPLSDENKTLVRGKLGFDGERAQIVALASYSRIRHAGASHKLIARGTTGLGILQVAAQTGGVNFAPSALATPAAQALIPAALAGLDRQIGGHIFDTTSNIDNFARFRSYTFGLDAVFNLTDNLDIHSITGYYDFDSINGTDLDGTLYSIGDTVQAASAHYLSQELQLQGKFGALDFVVGVYAGDEKGHESSRTKSFANLLLAPGLPPGTISINDYDARNRNLAVFAQANYKITDRTRVTAGYRYSWDERGVRAFNRGILGGVTTVCRVPAEGAAAANAAVPATLGCGREFKDTFSAASWLLSVDHELSNSIFGYAKVARGFRSGGQNAQGNTTADSFLPFKPETVQEYEVGLKFSNLFNRPIRFNVAGYYDDYKDIQKSRLFGLPNGTTVTRVANAAKARIQGFEAEASGRITDRLQFNAAVGLIDAKFKEFIDLNPVTQAPVDRSGEDFQIPKWTASGGLGYTFPVSFGEVSFSGDVYWQDDTNVNIASAIPIIQRDFALVNGRIEVKIDSADVTVAGYMRNVFDKKYIIQVYDLRGSFGVVNANYGDPRTFGIEVTKRF